MFAITACHVLKHHAGKQFVQFLHNLLLFEINHTAFPVKGCPASAIARAHGEEVGRAQAMQRLVWGRASRCHESHEQTSSIDQGRPRAESSNSLGTVRGRLLCPARRCKCPRSNNDEKCVSELGELARFRKAGMEEVLEPGVCDHCEGRCRVGCRVWRNRAASFNKGGRVADSGA